MKNNILPLITLAFLMLMGCGDSAKESTTISVIGENAANIQTLMALESEYEKSHPNIDLSFKPNSFDDAFNKSNQDFVNGTGLYDIVMQYNFSLSSFVRNGYVFKVDELTSKIPDSLRAFEKDLYPNSWQEVGYYQMDKNAPAVKVGYPFASNSMVLMYNQELFNNPEQRANYKKKYNEELTVPSTFEQMVKVAAFFTQPDKELKGICIEGSSGGWLYYEFVNYLFGMGGKVMDKERGWQGDANTQLLLNSPEAIKALTLYKSLKPYNSGNYTNVEPGEKARIMKEGKTAMAIMWSDVLYSNIKTDKGFDSRFAFAPVPGDKSLLAGGAFFINKKSKNPDAAIKYIVDVMQPKSQIELTKKGLCSALKTVYDDPEVQKIPYAKAVQTSLNRGVYMLEAGPDAQMISDKMTAYIQQMWNDELTPEAAAQKMQEEISAERAKIFKELK